jgi:PAS domain S-box-containing protein
VADQPPGPAGNDDALTPLEAEVARLRAALAEAEARLVVASAAAPAGGEDKFHAIAESIDQMIWSTRPDGFHDYFNSRWYEYTGVPDGSTDGAEWNGMFHPDDQERAWAVWRHSLETGEPYHIEYRLRHRSGAYRWVLGRAQPVRGPAGAIVRWYGTCTDIDDLKAADEARRTSEERLRVALSAGSLGDWSWDLASDVVTLSEQAAALFGLPPGPAMTWAEMQAFIHPDDAPAAAAGVAGAIAEGSDYGVEYRVTTPEGRKVWIHSVGRPIYGEDGAPTGMIGAVQDITARRTAEGSLREQGRILETLNRTGQAVAAELDLQRLVQLVTDAGVELTGAQFGAFFYNVLNDAGESYMLYTLSGADRSQFERFGMPRATAVFHPTFVGEGTIRSDDIKKDPRYGQMAPHFGMPKGHLPVTSYLAVPVASRSGEIIGGLFFGHPEPARFTEVHERLMTGIAAQAAVGIDNARLYQAAQKELADRMRAEAELRRLNETLEQRVAEEIARRSDAEEALRQAQKMETLGQLTGGVAHDFNNLLQIVTGNLDILQRNLPADAARLRRSADNALRGAERATLLTQRLLAFSRRQPLTPRPVDLNTLVAGMSELLHRTLGETIAVETVLASGLWQVEADSNQLENAILNLAVNARDAMLDGGRLTIETANTHLDRGYVAQNAEVAPGQYVAICVSDTGSGMDPGTVQRVFEPFFTTKDVGKGTGLGLSMVYGFVKQSGGHVKIYSEPGEGTTVRIYLPRLHGIFAEEEQADEAPVPEGTRDETILVCEDDDDVRAYSVEVLRELGYRVIEAHDGPSALRLLQRQEARVDLLFTDVVLPGGMTGAVLADEAVRLRPGLKVLFTTGYARNAIVHHGRLDPGVELITKPFTYADLASRVREILDGDG